VLGNIGVKVFFSAILSIFATPIMMGLTGVWNIQIGLLFYVMCFIAIMIGIKF
jgi:hypothetical protein